MRILHPFNVILGALLSLALLLAQAPAALAQNTHTLPLFMSASDMARQGFARIINLLRTSIARVCDYHRHTATAQSPCYRSEISRPSPDDLKPCSAFNLGLGLRQAKFNGRPS